MNRAVTIGLMRRHVLCLTALLTCVWLNPDVTYAEDAPTLKVPQPPPGVYRDPDYTWDLKDIHDIRHGWLSEDGRTFWCVVDRGEPINVFNPGDGKLKREPVFLELDLVTRTITREVGLPDDGPWLGGRQAVYLPKADRLIGWMPSGSQLSNKYTPGAVARKHFTHTRLDSLDLQHPSEPESLLLILGQPLTSDPDWRWKFSNDNAWIWLLEYQDETDNFQLYKLSARSLQIEIQYELDWARHDDDQALRLLVKRSGWHIDETTNQLWLADYQGDSDHGRLHWVRFNLDDGTLIDNKIVSEDVANPHHPSFAPGGTHITAAVLPQAENQTQGGPMGYWRLPQLGQDFLVDPFDAGYLSAGPLLGDTRYLFSSGSMDPNGERVAWRYDRERKAWSWPRKIVVPQGMTHRRFAADGSTMVCFNLINGRKNRLAVYRFGDLERYDQDLAETMSRQRSGPPATPALPDADITIKVSPDSDEVAVDRHPLPTPPGRIIQAHASADGKRIALWMNDDDKRPKGNSWHSEPADPDLGWFKIVVLDAETGKAIRVLKHPPGYTHLDLHQFTRLALSGDARWLVSMYAHKRVKLGGMREVPGKAKIQVTDLKSGDIVADRDMNENVQWWFRDPIDHRMLKLRSSSMSRPVVSGFEFCRLPSLDPVASMNWTWPDNVSNGDTENAVAQDLHYEPKRNRFVALMREVGGWYNGRHIPINYWIQTFEAETKKPIGRGLPFYAKHGAQQFTLRHDSVVVGYDHPMFGSLVQVYRYDSARPSLRIDGKAFTGGVFFYASPREPWIVIHPGARSYNKPGLMLVNTVTREVLGPFPIVDRSEILWISDDGRRILFNRKPGNRPPDTKNSETPIEWLTVRERE